MKTKYALKNNPYKWVETNYGAGAEWAEYTTTTFQKVANELTLNYSSEIGILNMVFLVKSVKEFWANAYNSPWAHDLMATISMTTWRIRCISFRHDSVPLIV